MKIYAITGRKGAGKSTLADYFSTELFAPVLSFAMPLKAALSYLIQDPEMMDPTNKEMPCHGLGEKSPREAMQMLGDFYKEKFGEDVFLKAMLSGISHAKGSGFESVIIDDVRFDEEAEFLRELGATIYSVHRDHEIYKPDNHKSEAGISPNLIDMVVFNREGVQVKDWLVRSLSDLTKDNQVLN